MTEPEGKPGGKEPVEIADQVGARAARKLRAREGTGQVWFGLGMMGLIGWSVVIPTLIGAAIGVWLDRRGGGVSWTLALLMAGLVVGCMNAWYWVSKEEKAMSRERGESDD